MLPAALGWLRLWWTRVEDHHECVAEDISNKVKRMIALLSMRGDERSAGLTMSAETEEITALMCSGSQ